MKTNILRGIGVALIAGVAGVFIAASAASAAAPKPPLPAGTAKAAIVAPMAAPANACGIRQNTLFMPVGASVSTAQLQSAFGVAVRDTSRSMSQAPGAGPPIWQSGGAWASGTVGATALLESTAAWESRTYMQVVWQPC